MKGANLLCIYYNRVLWVNSLKLYCCISYITMEVLKNIYIYYHCIIERGWRKLCCLFKYIQPNISQPLRVNLDTWLSQRTIARVTQHNFLRSNILALYYVREILVWLLYEQIIGYWKEMEKIVLHFPSTSNPTFFHLPEQLWTDSFQNTL